MIPRIFTRHPGMLMAALLAVSLLASFGWSLHAPTFITHESSMLRLPLLAWWRNVPLIFSRDFLMFSEGQFRPLSYALLAVVRTFVSTQNVLFWHIWLLAFHGLNAALVFLLLRLFSKWLWSAGLAAFLFALHPVASVGVNNVDHFHYILGLTFYLGALCCYLYFADTLRKGLYAASVGLFVLGLFTSKVVFTLPLVLGAYEGLYRRSGLRTVFRRLLAFVVLSLALSPLWWLYKPHPLYYKYMDFPEGAGWYSFFSVVGATGWYARGMSLGWGIPVVLHETVERIFHVTHWRFVLWGVVDLAILIGGGWALRRKRWAGLGVVVLFGAMLPFVSTAWNGVTDYLSWVYLYVPVVGWAFLGGGLADALRLSRRRDIRVVGEIILCLAGLYYGVQQARLNLASRSALGYWGHIAGLNPGSETASLALGQAYLEEGEESQALRHLFSPAIKAMHAPSWVMSRYYGKRGDYLAAAVHLRMAVHEEDGLQFQDHERAAAEVLYPAGAPEYAQEALGAVLTANPYNVVAMERLAEIWLLKGHVTAAHRLIDRALELAPSDRGVCRMRERLDAWREAGQRGEVMSPMVVHPPESGWLRYVIEGVGDLRLREEIVRLSERHPRDPVIQIEAGVCLVRAGQYDRALSKLNPATQVLSSWAYAWAMKCWAAAEAGVYEEARVAGQRAQELDPQSSTVSYILGILGSKLAGDLSDPAYQQKREQAIRYYQQALQLNPRNASAYNSLGSELMRQGKLDEAITYFRQALQLRPDYAQAHYNVGVVLLRQGKPGEAIGYFRKALQLRPDYAKAHNNLGVALLQQGKREEAIVHFQEALRINPDYTKARENLNIGLMERGTHSSSVSRDGR